jgi:hypothetical protein
LPDHRGHLVQAVHVNPDFVRPRPVDPRLFFKINDLTACRLMRGVITEERSVEVLPAEALCSGAPNRENGKDMTNLVRLGWGSVPVLALSKA